MLHHRRPLRAAAVMFCGLLVSCDGSPIGGKSIADRTPHNPDQRVETYKNPILFSDYSDPDVIRVGGDFYLTASSFNCVPGLPILHSRDLVNWTIVNHALRRVPGQQYDKPLPGCGVWAPSIRFHQGKYWIFFPTPDEGIYVITATDPAGEWSQPVLMAAGKGLIDPCPLWDDDGKAYLVHAYARSRAGIKSLLRVCPMAPDGSKLLGEGQIVFNKPAEEPTLEGPKFFKRNGWYYISAPAGGVPTGWQLVMRAKNPFGPYVEKVVLEQGGSSVNGPHQGALVDLKNGAWWFVHFQDRGVYGRITHLQPVRWADDWPLIGVDTNGNGVGEPVMQYRKPDVGGVYPADNPQTSDDFTAAPLGLQWQWNSNPATDWMSLTERPGWLRLRSAEVPAGDFAKAGNLLLQKLPAAAFIAETKVEPNLETGEFAGLIVMGLKHAALCVEPPANPAEGNYKLVLRVNNTPVATQMTGGEALRLRVEMKDGGLCQFAFAADADPFQPIGDPFQAKEGQWIGARVGLFSISPAQAAKKPGYADFDYFHVNPLAAGK